MASNWSARRSNSHLYSVLPHRSTNAVFRCVSLSCSFRRFTCERTAATSGAEGSTTRRAGQSRATEDGPNASVSSDSRLRPQLTWRGGAGGGPEEGSIL